ncbi:putative C-type lectin domain family 20 member A isoform X2 [Acipenser ruthenus]|uniref:putative C-type lectin domain family 20 member A isoform X2 n=1 Tax=Acipenser ruthenus TaxID=7906 RepID=UPI0027404D3C|nr:putative C-type lectin domain family 20 member A isoform X2 [Acipenser ruthenus]XP_058867020.1 putative C-type lectin domain family 20 member A isoform X2 [Acipenser ruthenus]
MCRLIQQHLHIQRAGHRDRQQLLHSLVIESAVMGERGLLILLLAGLCGPASNQIRKHVFVPITLSWSLAQTYCRQQHTDLATVRSQEEAEQLLTLSEFSLIDSAWIGLYRDNTQNWKWSNSDDVIYSNWNSGEPNNVFGIENCVIMSLRNGLFTSRGKWVDVVCGGILPFFCYEDIKPTNLSALIIQNQESSSLPSTLISQDPNPSDLPSTPASKDPNPSDLPSTPASKEAEPSSLPSTLISQDPNPSDLPSTPASKDPKPSRPPSTPVTRDPNPSDLPSTPASKDHMAIGRVKLTAPKGMNLEDPKVSEAILEQIREYLSKNFPMEGVKMRWRKQDGEIFHKDEEEEETSSEP